MDDADDQSAPSPRLAAAVLSAFAMMQVRKLVQTERTEAIVIYFFISASVLSLLTLPFGWVMADAGSRPRC